MKNGETSSGMGVSERAAKYWLTILKTYVEPGKPLPRRLQSALRRRLRISIPHDPPRYVPLRTSVDVEFLEHTLGTQRDLLTAALSLNTEIPIRQSTESGSGTGRLKHETHPSMNEFRFPSYAENVRVLLKTGRPLLLVGPNGSGKTRLLMELAKEQGQTVRRVNFDGSMTPEAFLGATKVRVSRTPEGAIASETYFQPGPVTQAAEEGSLLILDEIDRAAPEYLTALQALLEDGRGPVVLNDDGGRIVRPHPEFRVAATANSLGQPEDLSGAYAAGVQQMNASLIDRFTVMRVGFPENEEAILRVYLDDRKLCSSLVKLARLARRATEDGQIAGFDFSTRRLIAIAVTLRALNDLEAALEYELLARQTAAARSLLESLVVNVFGNAWRSITFSPDDVPPEKAKGSEPT